jgi:hypothetical protein
MSTCGSTHPASQSYETHFEDEFGVVTTKSIARPHILEWVYDYLPLIDEHNKQGFPFLSLEDAKKQSHAEDRDFNKLREFFDDSVSESDERILKALCDTTNDEDMGTTDLRGAARCPVCSRVFSFKADFAVYFNPKESRRHWHRQHSTEPVWNSLP